MFVVITQGQIIVYYDVGNYKIGLVIVYYDVGYYNISFLTVYYDVGIYNIGFVSYFNVDLIDNQFLLTPLRRLWNRSCRGGKQKFVLTYRLKIK